MLNLSTLILAAALGQAPGDIAWLDAIPAETDVVVRFNGVETVQKDLTAMIKAMSASLGSKAEPALTQGAAGLVGFFGENAAKEPFVFLIRAEKPEDPSLPPVAILVRSTNHEAVLKAFGVGGKPPELKKEEGGFESFATKDGHTLFIAKKGSHTLFGPGKALIAAFAKGGGKSFVSKLPEADKKRLASGDVGVSVNLDALTSRYAEAIAQGKQAFMAALDNVPQQPQTASMMTWVKKLYGGMFDSIKDAGVLTLSFDFSAEALNLNVGLTVKDASGLAKSFAAIKPGTVESLGSLPVGAAYYVYMNLDSGSYEHLQKLGLGMMGGEGKSNPELDAILEKQRKLGRIETFGTTSIGGGMRALSVVRSADPKLLRDSFALIMKAMLSTGNPLNVFKDVKITPDAESYKGYSFTRCELVLDMEKVGKLQPGVPAGNTGAMLKALYGGDHITTWYGVNETQLMSVTEPSWEKAKAQIDAYLAGTNTLSATPGFKAVQSRLSEKASLLALISVQGLTRQFASQFGAMMNKPDLKPSPDMPKEPAFIGVSVNPTASEYEFDLVIPSTVGPAIEKGLIPVFRGLRPAP